MKKFKNPYDISKVVVPLLDLKIIDPGTVLDSSDNYLDLSSYSAKRLAALLNMGSGQFSKKLHSLEPSIWTSFLNQRLGLKDIQEILSNNNAIVIDNTVVTISEGDSHVEDVVSAINEYINDEKLSTSYLLYEKELLVVISVDSEGYGVLLKYYYQDNWVTIHDCYYDSSKQNLIVSPYKELDSKVEEDISILMNKDSAIASSIGVLPYQIDEYVSRLESTYMSVEELISYLKKIFKIRLSIDPIDLAEYSANNKDIEYDTINQLEDILSDFYSNPELLRVINSPYLKRATSMTNITYAKFNNLIESLFFSENNRVHINTLIDFQYRAMSRSTNYDAIKS